MALNNRSNQMLNLTRQTLKHILHKANDTQHGGMLLAGDPGIGKEQPLTSKILTPSGWKLMGDMVVGDKVVTPSGEIANVTGVYPQGVKDIYTVTFHDGSQAECGLDHLWECWYSPYSTRPAQRHVITTKEIMSLISKMDEKGYNSNISVRLITPLDVPATDYPIPPYVLGALIGDGCMVGTSVTFTSTDDEIVNAISQSLPETMSMQLLGHSSKEYSITTRSGHRVVGKPSQLKQSLCEMQLFGSRAWEKFIPDIYMSGSVGQRWELLQGLMDTDGTVSNAGHCSYTTTSSTLAKDVQRLVWSLGGCASISSRTPSYTYNGEKKDGRVAYTVSIAVPTPKRLFKLSRKAGLTRDVHGDGRVELRRRIRSVELTSRQEAQCIMIDHPDHLYITDDYVVTHNTTFCNMFGKLLGVNVITIEIPHIVEEHLINIPFIVFNPETNQQRGGTTKGQIGKDDYKLVLADSHLYQQMVAATAVSDSEYPEYIKRCPADVQRVYAALGGSPDKIPKDIQAVRSKINNILFLDEFYRETSPRIRNILRGILNGNIGMHQIPASTYIMYASNMRDEGLDEIPQNQQFGQVRFKAPSKDEWFVWLAGVYSREHSVPMNPSIVNKMQQCLNDEDVSYEDAASSVRTSPRRWEQIMLYLNTSLPVDNKNDARALLTNVKNQFIHYATEEHSNLAEKVINAVTELISETSGINLSAKDELEPHEWRHALSHAIEQLERGGESKRHVPVISGPPGIGKTKFVNDIAHEKGLMLIDIDVSELFADDITGNPLPAGQRGDHSINVKFSLPKLYFMITKRINEKDAAYKAFLKSEYPDDYENRIAQYQKKRWKYLIFFDELNRCDQRTLNSLRRVMLEKNFGPDEDGQPLTLPKSALVVGAWNPDPSTGGTSSVTKHFADVVDVIPAKSSWHATKQYLSKRKFPELDEHAHEVVLRLLGEFVDKFKTRADVDENGRKVHDEYRAFLLDFNGKPLYFSPREYADMQSAIARGVELYMEDVADEPDASIDERREVLDDYIVDAIDQSLSFSLVKQFIPEDSVMPGVEEWERHLPDALFGGLLSRKVDATVELHSTLKEYLSGKDVTSMVSDEHFVNNHNVKNNAEIVDELIDLFKSTLTSEESFTKYVLDQTHPTIERDGDELKYGSGKSSLLHNFVMAMMYTLAINDYDNLRLATTGSALSQAASKIRSIIADVAGDDIAFRNRVIKAITTIRGEIQDVVESGGN